MASSAPMRPKICVVKYRSLSEMVLKQIILPVQNNETIMKPYNLFITTITKYEFNSHL